LFSVENEFNAAPKKRTKNNKFVTNRTKRKTKKKKTNLEL